MCVIYFYICILIWVAPSPWQLQEGPGLPQSAGDVNPDGRTWKPKTWDLSA